MSVIIDGGLFVVRPVEGAGDLELLVDHLWGGNSRHRASGSEKEEQRNEERLENLLPPYILLPTPIHIILVAERRMLV